MRNEVVMPLSDFAVLHAPHEHDGTIIHCHEGRERVIAFVTRTALADYFGWPKHGRDTGRLPISECNLVVDRHLDTFRGIIEEKYRLGDYDILHRFTSSLPYITITLSDIRHAGAVLTDTVIDMSRASRFA
jgi:hypothetical protein